MSQAVLDANAIIGLAKGEVLHLLPQLFEAVFSVPEIEGEILDSISRPQFQRASVKWLKLKSPKISVSLPLTKKLSNVDRSVLALSISLHPVYLITDDTKLTLEANKKQVETIKVPDVVVSLRNEGFITSTKGVLDRMIERGFEIEEKIYRQALKESGELE